MLIQTVDIYWCI